LPTRGPSLLRYGICFPRPSSNRRSRAWTFLSLPFLGEAPRFLYKLQSQECALPFLATIPLRPSSGPPSLFSPPFPFYFPSGCSPLASGVAISLTEPFSLRKDFLDRKRFPLTGVPLLPLLFFFHLPSLGRVLPIAYPSLPEAIPFFWLGHPFLCIPPPPFRVPQRNRWFSLQDLFPLSPRPVP